LLRRCGVMFISRPGGSVVPETLANARASGFPYETLDAAGVRLRSPAVAVADDATALFDPRAGVVSPEQAVTAQLRLAARAGAVLRFDETILDVSSSGDSVSVRTNLGSYGAKRLVLCTGAWSPGLLPGRVPLLRVQRQVQHWFEVPADRTAMFDPEKFPVHVWEDAELFYCMPMLDGPGGGVKCCVELDPPPVDPDALDRAVAPADVAAARGLLARYVPAASGRWLRGSVCMYAATPDNRFAIGPLPGSPQIVLATGLGGHGFKFTPAIGELAADFVTGAIDTASARAAPFDPARFPGLLAA
jgi:sarcosine oxidase